MKDLIAKLHSDAADQILATFSTLEMQLQGFAKSSYEKDLRIAELEAQLAAKPAGTDKLRQAILAILPNPPASLDKHESASYCVDFRAGLKAAAELVASTALQAPVREVPGWQPIETAPKDGTRIMIFMGAPWARIVTVRWFDLWENWQEGDFPEDKEEYCGIGSLVPTHWMSLPAAPVQKGGE